MPISCPKCNILNPRGAEICGQCGFGLTSVATSRIGQASSRSPLPSSAQNKGKSHLTGASIFPRGGRERKNVPLLAQLVSGVLWILSALLIALSIFLIKPGKVILPIPWLSSPRPYSFRLLWALVILAGGIYTTTVAYGICALKRWGLKLYISWVMVQVILEILARIYHQQLGVYLSALVSAELIAILLLWKRRQDFSL